MLNIIPALHEAGFINEYELVSPGETQEDEPVTIGDHLLFLLLAHEKVVKIISSKLMNVMIMISR